MKSRLFILPLLAFSLALPAFAQPTYQSPAPADYQAPKADLEKWATRLKKLCPPTGWTVKVEGNDILVELDRPGMIRQSYRPPHLTRNREKLADYQGVFRLTLGFAPLMSLDKYEELSAANRVLESEKKLLLQKNNLSEFYGVLVGGYGVPNKAAYEEESKKLVFNRLPHYFCPDYSITVSLSWKQSEQFDSGDRKVDAECLQVKKAVASYFGSYYQLNNPSWLEETK